MYRETLKPKTFQRVSDENHEVNLDKTWFEWRLGPCLCYEESKEGWMCSRIQQQDKIQSVKSWELSGAGGVELLPELLALFLRFPIWETQGKESCSNWWRPHTPSFALDRFPPCWEVNKNGGLFPPYSPPSWRCTRTTRYPHPTFLKGLL